MEVDGVIRVYVCDCGNHYSAGSMGKLSEQFNRDIKQRPTHNRARCPNCGAQRKQRWAWIIPEDHVREVLAEAGIPQSAVARLR